MGWQDGEFPEDEESTRFDDVELGGGVADGKTMENIDNDVSMGPPVGDRGLVIKSVKFGLVGEDGAPQEKMVSCYKDGVNHTYMALNCEVELAWEEDLSKTIRDFFVFPPGMGNDPGRKDEVDLYLNATKEDVKPTKANTGFHWRKLNHFLGHAGMPVLSDGQIGRFSVRSLRVWPDDAPRKVTATIDPPPKDGKYKSIRLFSYKDHEETVVRKNSSSYVSSSSASESVKNGSKPAKGGRKAEKAKTVAEAVADVDI